MLRKAIPLLISFFLLLGSMGTAQETIYNNFQSGHGGWDYNWGLGWTVAGVNVASQYGVEQAMSFNATASGVVSDIWIPMWYVPLDPGVDVVTVRLVKNPNGLPPLPGDVMEEWTITTFESWTHWSEPHHLKGRGVSHLEAGQDYWLWASGGDTTWCGWCLNLDPKLLCPHTLRREGEKWLPVANETAGAFRVDIVPGAGLSVDTVELKETAGGTINFNLDAGIANSSRTYLILGSLSGIEPGLILPGGLATLPLNWDIFTNLVINLTNSAVLLDFYGTLDMSGRGAAQLNTLGPLPSGTAGIQMHFAFMLFDTPLDFASNPVLIEITP